MALKDYLSEAEKELLQMYDMIQLKLRENSLQLDENGAMLIKDTRDLIAELKVKAETAQTIQANEELHFQSLRDESKMKCPQCNAIVTGNVIGEEKDKDGARLYRKHCPECGTDFTDPIPFMEEDYLRWQENLVNEFTKSGTDGTKSGQPGFDANQLKKLKEEIEELKSHLKVKAIIRNNIKEVKKMCDESAKAFYKKLSELYASINSKNKTGLN